MDVLTLALAKAYARTQPGPPGDAGSRWFDGEGEPGEAIGVDGDYYLDALSGDVYHKDGSWTVTGNILGPPGPQGEDGSLIGNYDGGRPASVYANLRMDGGSV